MDVVWFVEACPSLELVVISIGHDGGAEDSVVREVALLLVIQQADERHELSQHGDVDAVTWVDRGSPSWQGWRLKRSF